MIAMNRAYGACLHSKPPAAGGSRSGVAFSRLLAGCLLIGLMAVNAAALAQTDPAPAQDSAPAPADTDTRLDIYSAEGPIGRYSDTQTTKPLPVHWPADAQVLTAKSPITPMRRFAGRTYPQFHVIEQGERVWLLKQRNHWYKVETVDGKIGWVAESDMAGFVTANARYLDLRLHGWQERSRYRWQLGLMAGTLDNAIAYTPFAQWRFTPNFTLEAQFTQAFGDYSTFRVSSLSLNHQPFPAWRFSPYFKLGTGEIHTRPNTVLVQSIDRKDPVLTVGSGLFGYLSSQFVLRIEYNQHSLLTTRNVNDEVEEWKAGFGVLF
jgi:uncharacterized protein YgiM (DUF1202 family)